MLTEDQIKTIIANRMKTSSSSLSSLDTEFNEAKEKALKYYYGDTTDLPVDSDTSSKINSNDVSEVIDSAMPSLMRTFASGDDVVRCRPKNNGDDKIKAEQSTDYINYVLKSNSGFLFIQDWIKDGLISRIGFAKAYWEDDSKEDITRYQDLEPDIAEALNAVDVGGGFFEVTETKAGGKLRLEVLPPEEVWIDPTCKSIPLSPIVAHGRYVTLSDAREMGLEVSIDDVSNEILDNDNERIARDRNIDSFLTARQDDDESQQQIMLFEAYTKLDINETGIASLYKVFFIGSDCKRILHIEPCERCQIVSWTAIRMPHRLMGKSLADDVIEIQNAKTYTTRSMMNNLALQNNPRRYVLEQGADVSAVQENEIGQVIPIKVMGAVQTEVTPNVSNECLSLVQYLDQVRERRTGIRQFNSSVDGIDNAYNQTATGVQMRENAGNASIELIARNFAETGLKDLCKLILWLGSQHENTEIVVGEKSLISSNFDPDLEIEINLGLGTNDKATELQRAQLLFQASKDVLEAQSMGLIPKYLGDKGIREILNNYWAAMGYKDHETYFETEEDIAAQEANKQPPPNPEQEKMQFEMQKYQTDAQIKMQIHQDEMAFKERERQDKLALQREQLQIEADLKLKEMQMQFELKALDASNPNITNGASFGGDNV